MARLRAFRPYGAERAGVPRDVGGWETARRAAALAGLARQGRHPKFIYVVPDFQNPSGITWTEERRRALLQLATQYDTLVVEDNPYREIRFEGSAPPPIYALDGGARTIYLSTFSKTLAPGLRIGWMVAQEEIIAQFVTAKQGMDLCSPSFTQAIAAEMLRRGILYRRLPNIAAGYRRKRDAMLRAPPRERPSGVPRARAGGGGV